MPVYCVISAWLQWVVWHRRCRFSGPANSPLCCLDKLYHILVVIQYIIINYMPLIGNSEARTIIKKEAAVEFTAASFPWF
ncbi:MAG: hypothetical protein A2173_05340 [Planctomycetes bacterium RBG_13_44_8b]|nr:MAG: hypothetical protein A2173_05340 [Planctomycetes bacterium RBG_13_44_8b]